MADRLPNSTLENALTRLRADCGFRRLALVKGVPAGGGNCHGCALLSVVDRILASRGVSAEERS